MRRVDVDLHDMRRLGIELAPGKIAAQQQERVAFHQGVIAGLDTENTGHPDIERIVILDEILGARGVRHRRLQPAGQRDDLAMRALAARAAIDRYFRAGIQQRGDAVEHGIARAQDLIRDVDGEGRLVRRRRLRDIDRHDEHRDAALGERRLCRHRRLAPRLRRRADLVAEDAAGAIDRHVVDLLRKVEAQFVAGDLAGDQHDRRTIAVGFEQAVDEMQAAGAARSGAGGQPAGKHGLRARREAADLLVANMHPCDVAAANGIGDEVERVARHPPTMLHARRLKGLDDHVGDSLMCHGDAPMNAWCRRAYSLRV